MDSLAERNVVWRKRWFLGPLFVGGVLATLTVGTVAEMKARGRIETNRELAMDLAGWDAEVSPGFPLAEDPATVAQRLDLSSLPAAKRLWESGRRQPVLDALLNRQTPHSLRLQLLLLVGSDRSANVANAAMHLEREFELPGALKHVLRAMLGSQAQTTHEGGRRVSR